MTALPTCAPSLTTNHTATDSTSPCEVSSLPDSALQNDRPVFKKIARFFFVYIVTCKQRFFGSARLGRRSPSPISAPIPGTLSLSTNSSSLIRIELHWPITRTKQLQDNLLQLIQHAMASPKPFRKRRGREATDYVQEE